MNEGILVAVDESPASHKAVEYVAKLVTGRPDYYVHLVHVAYAPVPAAAASGPKQPARGGQGKERVEESWLDEAKERARTALETMRRRLLAAGLKSECVDVGFLAVRPNVSMVDGMLDIGRDQKCDTIVVGRNSLPRHRELFHHHPADELVRKGQGFTVWVVE